MNSTCLQTLDETSRQRSSLRRRRRQVETIKRRHHHLLGTVILKERSVAVVWASYMASRSNILSIRGQAVNITHLRQQRQRAQASRQGTSEKPISFPLPRVENDGQKLSPALHHRRAIALRLAVNLLARSLMAEVCHPNLSNSTTLPRTEQLRGSTLRAMRHGRLASAAAASPNVLVEIRSMPAGSVGGPQGQEEQRVQLVVVTLLVQHYPSILPVILKTYFTLTPNQS